MHKDYFGSTLDVGDIVMGATPRKNHYQDVSYSFAVVIGKTKKMVRLHKIGESLEAVKQFHTNPALLSENLVHRRNRRGGAVPPEGLIKTQLKPILKPDAIKQALETKVKQEPAIPLSSIFTI